MQGIKNTELEFCGRIFIGISTQKQSVLDLLNSIILPKKREIYTEELLKNFRI